MAVTENVERVYPTRSELETESQTNVPCPVAGCLKIFRQPSALRFHMVKLHKLILNESDARLAQHLKPQTKKQYEFYCPESGCRFSANEQKFFQSYKKLKQHFMRLHAHRSLACFICGEKFGLNYDFTHHVNRCRRKPWCSTCGLCMGSQEMLALHVSETGHEALREEEGLENVNDAVISNRHIGEAGGTALVKECADSSRVGQSANVSQKTVMHESSLDDVVTEMLKNNEQTIERSDQITVIPSRELKEIVCSGISNDQPLSSHSRNDDTAEKSNHKTNVSQSKDNASLRRKKSLGKSKQDSKPRMILPASNLIVFPVQVGTMFFCTMPTNLTKPDLIRLAPRQSSSTQLELDQPVPGDCLVTNGCTRDMLAQDLKSVKIKRESESVSTQTRSRRIKVAETQTTERYVLKKTLGAHNAALARQSCGSQVSPRARLKRLNVQSIETQTATRSLARKHKPSASMQTNPDTISSVISSMPSSSSSTNIWPDFVHNETQTMALLQQLEASLGANSSTQTLESYLFDNLPNENCINASNDASSNACNAVNMLQDSVYATMTTEGGNLFNSVTLPIAEQPPTKQCTTSGNMNESGYGIFSPEFPSVMEADKNRRNFLIHDDMFVNEFPSSTALSAAACSNDIFAEDEKTFAAETQTMRPDSDFTDFLTAASQTNDFSDLMSTNTETQTVDDDFFTQFWSHMETQTTDEFLTEFGFSDTETQTTWAFREDVLDAAPGIPPPPPHHEPQGAAVLLDMETQTCFQ